METWVWTVGGFLAGALVGGGVVTLLRRGRDVEQRMRRLQREYDLYQADVARHFTQTGELLSRLRGAFEQLYGEVEDRATDLVGEEALQRRLRGVEDAHPHARPAAGPPTVGDDRSGAPGFGGPSEANGGGPSPRSTSEIDVPDRSPSD